MKKLTTLLLVCLFTLGVAGTAFAQGGGADKVWVCKMVGQPDDARLSSGKNPIHVSVNSTDGRDAFNDAHPSFVVESATDERCVSDEGPGPVLVTPTSPDPQPAEECDIPGRVGIPDSEGVSYAINGESVPTGLYDVVGDVVITAAALDGYELDGQTTWEWWFDDVVPCEQVDVCPEGTLHAGEMIPARGCNATEDDRPTDDEPVEKPVNVYPPAEPPADKPVELVEQPVERAGEPVTPETDILPVTGTSIPTAIAVGLALLALGGYAVRTR